MALTMERPAPVRLVTDGEGANMEPNTPTRRDALGYANRVYVQALIDLRDVTIPTVDAYADRLVNVFHLPTVENRTILRAAMVAFIDGWFAGYDEGYEAGVEEGIKIASGCYPNG